MASKAVLDRQRSSGQVVSVATAQADVIASALGDALTPHLEKGEKLPNLAFLTALLGRLLESLTADLVAADAAHEAELRDDAAPREARDAASAALYAHVTGLRQMVVGVYGDKAAPAIGIAGATPRDGLSLSRFAQGIENACESAKLPKSRVKGASLKLADIAAEVAALRAPLDTALKDVGREEREAQVTLAEKTKSVGAYDAGFAGIATVLEGLLLVAGKPDLAAKVKPSLRRPGQTQAAAGDDGSTGDGAGSPTAGADPPAAPTTGATADPAKPTS